MRSYGTFVFNTRLLNFSRGEQENTRVCSPMSTHLSAVGPFAKSPVSDDVGMAKGSQHLGLQAQTVAVVFAVPARVSADDFGRPRRVLVPLEVKHADPCVAKHRVGQFKWANLLRADGKTSLPVPYPMRSKAGVSGIFAVDRNTFGVDSIFGVRPSNEQF